MLDHASIEVEEFFTEVAINVEKILEAIKPLSDLPRFSENPEVAEIAENLANFVAMSEAQMELAQEDRIQLHQIVTDTLLSMLPDPQLLMAFMSYYTVSLSQAAIEWRTYGVQDFDVPPASSTNNGFPEIETAQAVKGLYVGDLDGLLERK